MDLTQTNFDLEEKCDEVGVGLNGIYCRDEIPKLRLGNFIFNTGLSTQREAGHWTCCKVYNDKILYWDSFGIGPMEELVKRAGKKKIYYNDKIIQNLTASTCGYWCIAFFCYLDKVMNTSGDLLDHYQSFINLFDNKNQKKNELLLKKFLRPF